VRFLVKFKDFFRQIIDTHPNVQIQQKVIQMSKNEKLLLSFIICESLKCTQIIERIENFDEHSFLLKELTFQKFPTFNRLLKAYFQLEELENLRNRKQSHNLEVKDFSEFLFVVKLLFTQNFEVELNDLEFQQELKKLYLLFPNQLKSRIFH
jgi:hypothetical protein